MNIYYYVPDNIRPSWGIGIIYNHVQILVKNGYNAFILHNKLGFKLPWLKLDVPIKYLENFSLNNLTSKDIMVFPEVCMDFMGIKNIISRKILLIQASGYIFESLPLKESHKTLGFTEVFVIMPHMLRIAEIFIDLPTHLIPPFIPDSFFVKNINAKREKRIIIYPKFHQIDYTIIKKLIYDKVRSVNKKFMGIINVPKWEVVELKGFKHSKIPKLMQNSSIFVSLNTFEALNTSVIEAMASGCIVFTYDGIGPRDYLIDEKNAFVFNNNEAYQLCEELFDFMDNYDTNEVKIMEIRRNALSTAMNYNHKYMEDALISTFKSLTKN